MSRSEFDLIQAHFMRAVKNRDDVVLGIGDDGAALKYSEKQDLIVSIDTLVAGVHFPEPTVPQDIAHKALAVNLSDLAAMGATPAWVTLSLTLPNADEAWVSDFCTGFFALADQHRVQLVGGDTTRGPLSVTVQAHGFVPTGQALRRDGAYAGDLIFVTGELGLGGWGLAAVTQKLAPEYQRLDHTRAIVHLNRPEPRLAVGEQLRGMASACIDLSDGLAGDLRHILERSQVGAVIDAEQIPLPGMYCLQGDRQQALEYALFAGDDYELCFTVSQEKLGQLSPDHWLFSACWPIGKITDEPGLRIKTYDSHGCSNIHTLARSGYTHFDSAD
ncbi:MAG: thiamine-phosphate kinase [Gammaproteobacteria bacterium]|nr:thiamine-phosphate kinase [Gammaproteobacteria bacterium]